MRTAPVLYWMRRDFRMTDNAALRAACAAGPVIPVFIDDEVTGTHGTAPRWRLGLAAQTFAAALADAGSRLIVRRGDALEVLRRLIDETGAVAVHWNRLYDPDARARDTAVKTALKDDGIAAVSHAGHLLHEPWDVATGTGGYYKVYTPFWRAVRDVDVAAPAPAPGAVPAPDDWPDSMSPGDLAMGAGMDRGAAVVRPHLLLGEASAQGRLSAFIGDKIADYAGDRDRLDLDGTSKLSEPLTYGEISVRTAWHAGRRAQDRGLPGAEAFLQELVWRDFAHHLGYHTPRLTRANWRPEWDAFPWRDDSDQAEAWRRGRTGLPVVDAAMREMYVTGRMHNRARMIVASYLTKHLMTHWRVGCDWFADCLVDWDPASNAMGWQWSAGSGPDATPYFRVFNPETQAQKFDPDGAYRARWLAEIAAKPGRDAMAFFDACPRAWKMAPDDPYPDAPIVGLKEGRQRALDAYSNRDF